MAAVAVVAHEVVGLAWAAAFVLGAIVSPTDAVAPAEIMRRIGAPRRLITIVEGENLTNDWTALVLYKVRGRRGGHRRRSRSAEAVPKFVLTGVGGVAIGLVAGRLIREVRARIDDPPTEITISILSGYAAYLPAEELGLSGVIAAVTVGLYMGWHTPQLDHPGDAPPGHGALGDPDLPPERGAVPAGRPSAAERDRPPLGPHGRRADRLGR